MSKKFPKIIIDQKKGDFVRGPSPYNEEFPCALALIDKILELKPSSNIYFDNIRKYAQLPDLREYVFSEEAKNDKIAQWVQVLIKINDLKSSGQDISSLIPEPPKEVFKTLDIKPEEIYETKNKEEFIAKLTERLKTDFKGDIFLKQLKEQIDIFIQTCPK